MNQSEREVNHVTGVKRVKTRASMSSLVSLYPLIGSESVLELKLHIINNDL